MTNYYSNGVNARFSLLDYILLLLLFQASSQTWKQQAPTKQDYTISHAGRH
jgi:hypothetical protein